MIWPFPLYLYEMNSGKLKIIGGHVLFWLLLMLTFAVSEWGYRDTFADAIIFELLFLPVRMVAVYLNYYVLIPKYLYQNKILSYLTLLLSAIMINAVLQRYIFIYWGYPVFFPNWLNPRIKPLMFDKIVQNAVIIATPVAFSIGIRVFSDWYKEKNKIKQLEKEKISTELKYLKSQINPHFLFNTLNNIYGLAIEKSDKVPGLILQLSDLLSYSLYESSQQQLPVEKELKLIRDYVAIEKERYGDRVGVIWEIKKEEIKGLEIAPLLFFPLVENAFKHGVKEETGGGQIQLFLSKEKEHLIFKVKNTIPADYLEGEQEKTGIGLSNVRRRLNLLYPNTHELKIEALENWFCVQLKIKL